MPVKKRKTLRDFGFTDGCEHPMGSVSYDKKETHCPLCGSLRLDKDLWRGGTVDYKIDAIVIKLFRKKLEENIQQ